MAGGNALLYGVVGFLAGVVMANSVRSLVQQTVGFEIPSFYSDAYQSEIDDYDTTRTSFVGAVSERDYDSNLETHINHINIE